MSSNKAAFAMFVGILSILAVIGGIFLWSQTTTEMTELGLITNRPYGALGFFLVIVGAFGIIWTLIELHSAGQSVTNNAVWL